MRLRTLSLSGLLLCLALVPAFSQQPSDPTAALPTGITLPRTGTVYAIDTTTQGPALVQLHPSEIASNSHAASNLARSMVYSGPRASIELKGLNANTSLSALSASFLVRISGDDPELMRSRIHLIRLGQVKDRRVVSNYSQNIFGGQRTKHYDDIPVTKTDADPDVWLKLTPNAPLAPGEYGIVFMPRDSNLFPDVVYDFNVAIEQAKPEK